MRRRRRASAIASSSQPKISAAEVIAAVPAERRTSNLRTKGLLGRVSHQGVTPTVCTTARTPTVGPSGAGRSPAAASTCPMLPMPETWSMSGGVQQSSATTSAAAIQTQPLRESLRSRARGCCERGGHEAVLALQLEAREQGGERQQAILAAGKRPANEHQREQRKEPG